MEGAFAQTPPGTIATLAGSGKRGLAANGDDAAKAELNNPYGMEESHDKSALYFVDNTSNRILRLDYKAKKIYVIAGTGDDRARLAALARAVGVSDRVLFLGEVGLQELVRAYRMADLFVMPSTGEGFGIAFLEAMACGLPAIASTATAGADVLSECSGRVLPVGDVDALVDALRWFDQNRDRLPAMSRAARKQAEHCTWERYRRAVTEATSRFV